MKRGFANFGKNSIIKPFLNCTNAEFISIGRNVNIGSFSWIAVSIGFREHKSKSKNKIRLSIGNNVDVGNNVFMVANNNLQIGNNVIISSYVYISDHMHSYEDVNKTLFEQPLTEGGYVIVEDNVFIGTKSSILKNVRIGRSSVIGANSVVTKDVPSYSVAVGNPAKVIKSYNFNQKKWVNLNE